MSLEHIAATSFILIAAYFIRGITGFGSGLIAVPLLALFLPLTFVVPFMLLLDFTASIVIGGYNLKLMRVREVLMLIPFGIVGVFAGTYLLVNLPQTPMLIILALFIFVFAIRSLFYLHGNKIISAWWSIPASLTGGTVAGLYGTGGPPYVIYLTHRIHNKSELRATLTALFFTEGATRIASFVLAGLLMSRDVWLAYVAALPVVLGGLYLGSRVHPGISASQMTRLVGILLLVSSISLLIKAMHA
ncbi:MAG: sulfite exporter TauE/SafE family protein [Gammaproteobacteria bacterium]|nr:sulfite exporter TauE/SafE family protein [Gammaproteobacteria bacterium]